MPAVQESGYSLMLGFDVDPLDSNPPDVSLRWQSVKSFPFIFTKFTET